MNSETEIPVITGPDCFDIEVLGESKYAENVAYVCASRGEYEGDLIVQAHLSLDGMDPFDDTAVAVSVNGKLVGHLPSATALEFRHAVRVGELTEYKVFACQGRIQLGKHANHAEYRIWIDLPHDSDDPQPIEAVKQPASDLLISVYRHAAVADRQIDELIGIVKGVMADGIVTQGEVEFLLRWMEANRQAANLWPAKALYPRLAQVVAKGFMNLHEEREMLDLLMRTIGGNTAPHVGFSSNSTKLPLTEPVEPLSFEGRAFCFTGTFHSGSREWCHSQVIDRQGRSIGNITKKLDYLVIGDLGTETWAHSTHGRKIEKAIAYNTAGCRIAIVSEEHWYSHL